MVFSLTSKCVVTKHSASLHACCCVLKEWEWDKGTSCWRGWCVSQAPAVVCHWSRLRAIMPATGPAQPAQWPPPLHLIWGAVTLIDLLTKIDFLPHWSMHPRCVPSPLPSSQIRCLLPPPKYAVSFHLPNTLSLPSSQIPCLFPPLK